ncbi:MAG: sterol desaturase family protein [Gammaproteobacteria bacterium]|nr:sterol desaturase family protein [Gammaproteobacteria bacterium]
MINRTASYLIYPCTLLSAIGLYTLISDVGWIFPFAAFGAITAGVLLIIAAEYVMPYAKSWRPRADELWTDFLYVGIVQIALPRLLAIAVAILLAAYIGTAAPLFSFWPHDWPVAAQAGLLVVSADFMRYWLHRAAHTAPLLWRLHAVHHSPHKLYWLNTSRFHPIEKIMQFSLDSLPFALMGVDPRILGFWFVIYSVNGFFQHSNIHLRFGVLSTVFSTAEMHRWHHSKVMEESNKNYANIFIVWDRLLGTYYRPVDRDVGELGLINRDYPTGFVRQMISPFIAGLDRQQRR